MPAWAVRLGLFLAQALFGRGEDLKKLLGVLLALLLFPLAVLMSLPLLLSHVPAVTAKEVADFFAAVQEVSAATETEDDPGIDIPWQEVVAAWAVLYDQDFSAATPDAIQNLAWNWAERHETTTEDGATIVWYTLRSFAEVMERLGFTLEQKDQAARYLVALQEGGLRPPPGWRATPSPGWAWPVPGHEAAAAISSPYGLRIHPITHRPQIHRGVDIAAPEGTPVLAARAGTVTEVGTDPALGNYVVIEGGGFETRYGHLSAVEAREGDLVQAGRRIGRVGSTGLSTGPHLHFEVRFAGEAQNPLQYF